MNGIIVRGMIVTHQRIPDCWLFWGELPLSSFPDTLNIVISKLFTVIELNAMTVHLYS